MRDFHFFRYARLVVAALATVTAYPAAAVEEVAERPAVLYSVGTGTMLTTSAPLLGAGAQQQQQSSGAWTVAAVDASPAAPLPMLRVQGRDFDAYDLRGAPTLALKASPERAEVGTAVNATASPKPEFWKVAIATSALVAFFFLRRLA